MEEKKTKMDDVENKEQYFSLKFRILLYTALVLTGMSTLMGILIIPMFLEALMGKGGIKLEEGAYNGFYWQFVFWLSLSLFFFMLMKIKKSKKPFSDRMIRCFMMIGILFVAGAVLFPFFPNYAMPNFLLFSTRGIFVDGWPFIGGIVLILVSQIMKYGLRYQKEIDTLI
ncbi:hypothetical protein [Extibacter muris]|uniref:hypothetical protein n=1 Tax=Extibacter muris TaxID=1796622 RepID=UPI001D089BC9|nr:hypothetical protein [Extibacter muris]MCB6203864.1 hypothetical protein [Extibacter muris]MCQ4665565.1 hypothetical protein [Extibacter muris]MCQ4694972.1 hypothetical protein [Extibacter muris]